MGSVVRDFRFATFATLAIALGATVQPSFAGPIVSEEALSQKGNSAYFTNNPISDKVFARINGKSWKAICGHDRKDFRYLRVLHHLSQKGNSAYFTNNPISDKVFARINGKSWKAICGHDRKDFRYLRVLHHDGHGHIRHGELIVHKSVAKDVIEVFEALYTQGYPIERMVFKAIPLNAWS